MANEIPQYKVVPMTGITIETLVARFGPERVERALDMLRFLAYDDTMHRAIADERELLVDLFRILEG